MRFFIFLLFIGTVVSSSFLSQRTLDSLWKNYKREFKKTYSQSHELLRRFVWEKNVLDIVQHNIQADLGFHSYRKGLNEYSDLSLDEYITLLTGFNSRNVISYNASVWVTPSSASIPDQIDWRKKGFVTPIKNQKTCGSCWAFSTTGSLEGQHKKKTGKLISLSEQNLIDCSKGNDGCNGGSIDAALDYIKMNNGIDTESSYPYQAMNSTCQFKKSGVGATCTGRVDLPSGDEEALKQAVATVGPISVIIDACHNSFISYKSGIFDEPKCRIDIPSHAVLVIGYGTENGVDYWLVKNSWGKSWGMQGYIKMSRNKNNQCGIASRATYPLT